MEITMRFCGAAILAAVSVLLAANLSSAEQPTPAERGYRFLTEKEYLPPDFDQETFDEVWRVWPEELRAKAASASPAERRSMAFSYYGLTERPGETDGKPLQYVVDEEGNWTMNCLACHGGKVAGEVIPGLPNSHFALATLTEDIRKTKQRTGKPLTRMDIGSLVIPLGRTNGTTNAVVFGVVLLAFRTPDLRLAENAPPPEMDHHDMDAPPWWHFKKRSRIYIDGFAEKGHRPLMQFMLVKENGPEKFREWESDYRDVYAYLESLQPPEYPWEIDRELAAAGKALFERNCAECHGTYGGKETYPNRVVPLEEIGTDPVRLGALTPEGRRRYGKSWFADYGEKETIADPGGYLAPPLDGVWASAPYLHNGSVPTLWHVLHPGRRPAVWHRSENGYDRERVGLEAESFGALPPTVTSNRERRAYFDSSGYGKSNAGHRFPDVLTEDQKRAVLEYLKTL